MGYAGYMVDVYIYIYIYISVYCIYNYDIYNPPTAAFAKAWAAPGTTGGVEPVFVGLLLACCGLPARAIAS